jgi:hypothetical protein
VIHEHLAHGAAGDVEEVRAVREGHAGLVHELEPRLVHELGGLQGVSGPLSPHERTGNPTKLRVGGFEEGLLGGRGTASHLPQEAGDIGQPRPAHAFFP